MTKVVITGVGLHTSFGDLEHTWKALCEGRSAPTAYRLPNVAGFPEVLAAPPHPYELDEYLRDRKPAKYMSPATKLAVLAAGSALKDGGLLGDEPRCSETALFISTGAISFDLSSVSRAIESCKTPEGGLDFERMGGEGLKMCHPLMPFKMLLNMPLGMVSIIYGVKGENFITYPGADQAGVGLESALRGIRTGRFRRALVGASVHGLGLVPLGNLLRQARLALANGKKRSGWAVTDLSAFLVLESEAEAVKRGAKPKARLVTIHQEFRIQPDPKITAGHWDRMFPDGPPDTIVSTGSLDRIDDPFVKEAAEIAWPQGPYVRMSFDGQLGYPQTAALPCSVGLASTMFDRGEALKRYGLSHPVHQLVYSSAPEESSVSVRLSEFQDG